MKFSKQLVQIQHPHKKIYARPKNPKKIGKLLNIYMGPITTFKKLFIKFEL